MCGGETGGPSLEGVDRTTAAVIQGRVVRDGAPLDGAYVRLLDANGDFTAEVPTNAAGEFRFFAGPGRWTLRTLAPRSEPVDRVVVAQRGVSADVTVTLG